MTINAIEATIIYHQREKKSIKTQDTLLRTVKIDLFFLCYSPGIADKTFPAGCFYGICQQIFLDSI